MIRSCEKRMLLASVVTVAAVACLHTQPAAAQSAAGAAAIQAANDAMNTIISDVAEGTTDAAGVFSGIPVHDAGLGAEIPELNTSLNEETMAAADGIMTAIYNQMGFPNVAPSALNAEFDGVVSTAPTATQALEQLPGTIDSAMGSEIAASETAAMQKDELDLKDGFGPSLNTRMTYTRQGLQGNAIQDLSEAALADDAFATARTTANEIKSLAGGIQMSVQTNLMEAKEINDERKSIANLTLATTLSEQHQDELTNDEQEDLTATKALLN